MPDELLMIMTSNGTLGDSGPPTGVWVAEVCVPLKAFRDARFIVSAASPLGGRPPYDLDGEVTGGPAGAPESGSPA